MDRHEFDKMLDTPSIKFILDQTMFAQLFYSLEHVELRSDDPRFAARGLKPTAYCDGKELGVNPEFFQSLPIPQQITVLGHETLHAALEHPWRFNPTLHDINLANIAMDFEVNAILVENKFAPLHESCWLYDAKYHGWPWEKIYEDLKQQCEKNGKEGGDGPGGMKLGMADVAGCPGDKAEIEEVRSRLQSKVVNAARMAEKMQGSIPEAFKRLIEKILCPPIPWHEVMRRFFRSINYNDYKWDRPDRVGFFKTRTIQPRLYSEQLDSLVICIDTSGSIGQKELNEFAYHTNGVIQETNPQKVYLIYINANVCGDVEEYDRSQFPITFEARGGGGTDFRPAFDWCKEHGVTPDVLLYFTDMYGTFPNDDPGFPTLWITATPNHKVPFGEVINFNDK